MEENDYYEWIPVKEYAERKGISQQATYFAISKGKLKSKEINGKKYVYTRKARQRAAAPTPDKDTAAHVPAAGTDTQQAIIQALVKQLEAKDRQLERQAQLLEEQIKLATKTLEETTKALQEITQIAQNEQHLQAHALQLQPAAQQQPAPAPVEYEDAAAAAPLRNTPAAETPAPAPEQPAQKQSLFSRLFKGSGNR